MKKILTETIKWEWRDNKDVKSEICLKRYQNEMITNMKMSKIYGADINIKITKMFEKKTQKLSYEDDVKIYELSSRYLEKKITNWKRF